MARTVLLVEDEDNIAVALEFLIHRAGHEARRLSSGHFAFEAIRDDPPDLVLLDSMLPGCSGEDVCRKVRSDHALDDVKIVLMSASGEIEPRSRSCGADAFMEKPFANETVRLTLERFLDAERTTK